MLQITRRAALTAGAALCAGPARAFASEKIRIGQAIPVLGFLPLWAARAFGSFPAAGLTLEWAAIPGGDPASLAALDAGDIDLAAVGSDAALTAIAKGQSFSMIYSMLSRMFIDVVASKHLLQQKGVSPSSPLQQRIAALKGAIIGIAALGGAQDRVIRWTAARGGLDPRRDLQIALVGGAPALQAALAHGRIDAFVLSPPEPQIAEAAGTGQTLISVAQDFPQVSDLPFLVLVAKAPVSAATHGPLVQTAAALQSASRKLLADRDGAANAIGARFFPKIDPAVIRIGVRLLTPGIANLGQFNSRDIEHLLQFAAGSGGAAPKTDDFWTNSIVDAAHG